MLFNSLQYLIFLPCVVAVYYALSYRFRQLFLLGSSYYFYMCWKPEYLILILISTISNYTGAIMMAATQKKSRKDICLVLCLAVNIGMLLMFKYFNFFNDSLHAVFTHYNIMYNVPTFDYLLPIGISFYVFQSLGYIIDIYREATKPEKILFGSLYSLHSSHSWSPDR